MVNMYFCVKKLRLPKFNDFFSLICSVALFLSWARQQDGESKLNMNPTMLGCIAGSILMRKAASFAFEHKKRSTLTSDIIECLGRR